MKTKQPKPKKQPKKKLTPAERLAARINKMPDWEREELWKLLFPSTRRR